MTRTKGTRRLILDGLRTINYFSRKQTTIYAAPKRSTPLERRPENDRAALAALVDDMHIVEQQAAYVRATAERRIVELCQEAGEL